MVGHIFLLLLAPFFIRLSGRGPGLDFPSGRSFLAAAYQQVLLKSLLSFSPQSPALGHTSDALRPC